MPRRSTPIAPEMPKACVLCGTPYGLSRQTIVVARREIDVPFCPTCWTARVQARYVLRVVAAFSLIVVAIGVGVSIATRSWPPALVALIVGGVSAGLSLTRVRRTTPKVRFEGKGRIAFEVPGEGTIRVELPPAER